MTSNFCCSEYILQNYAGKTVLVFENEGSERRYGISTLVSEDGQTFAMKLVAIGIASAKAGLTENQIAIDQKPVDRDILSKLEKPNSRFLNGRCDFVLFINSPGRKAQFSDVCAVN